MKEIMIVIISVTKIILTTMVASLHQFIHHLISSETQNIKN